MLPPRPPVPPRARRRRRRALHRSVAPQGLYKRDKLNGLGRYPDAIKALKRLLDKEPEDPAALNALAECELLQSQAFAGDYHMPSLLFGQSATSFRRCADYVGPVKIVEAARSAAASSPRAPCAPASSSASRRPWRWRRSPRAPRLRSWEASSARRLVTLRTGRDPRAPVRRRRRYVRRGSAGRGQVRRHLSKGDESLPELPPQEFSRGTRLIVKTSAVHTPTLWASTRPSFLNHGCAPNACKLMVGRTMFIRAAHDLVAGEEVFMKPSTSMPKRSARRWPSVGVRVRVPPVQARGRGRDEAAAAPRGRPQAKAAKDAAVADPANKKKGGDKDGEKAAARAAAESSAEDTGSVAMLIAQPAPRRRGSATSPANGRVQADQGQVRGAGSQPPGGAHGLVRGPDGRLGLSETQKAWAGPGHPGVLERSAVPERGGATGGPRGDTGKGGGHAERHGPVQLRPREADGDQGYPPEGRRGGAGKEKTIAAAEAEAAAVHSLRYGCGGGSDEEEKELMAEMIKITGHAVEGAQEFCEA